MRNFSDFNCWFVHTVPLLLFPLIFHRFDCDIVRDTFTSGDLEPACGRGVEIRYLRSLPTEIILCFYDCLAVPDNIHLRDSSGDAKVIFTLKDMSKSDAGL